MDVYLWGLLVIVSGFAFLFLIHRGKKKPAPESSEPNGFHRVEEQIRVDRSTAARADFYRLDAYKRRTRPYTILGADDYTPPMENSEAVDK